MSLVTVAAARLAWQEITLVAFTTLAPSGILACVLCALAAGVVGRRCGLDEVTRTRLSHLMVLPLAVSMVGLIASASHLGTPSNALYVLSGAGRSPLSNEVACCVVFTALAGLYWLYSFSQRVHKTLRCVWCCAVALSGLAALVSIALAYNAPTISTWGHWSTPLSLCCEACAGAPLLALTTATLARADVSEGARKLLLSCGIVALFATCAALVAQWVWLGEAHAGAVTGRDLVPGYLAFVAFYALLGALAYAVAVRADRAAARRGSRPSAGRLGLACAFYLAGLLAVRFAFYMTHMTVGIGL